MSLPRMTLVLCVFSAAIVPPARAAELEKLVPDTADLVVSVNLRQILDSALMKKHVLPEMELKFAAEAARIAGLLGLNPVKEVVSVTVAFPGASSETQWLGIVHGDFDVARLHAAGDKLMQSRPGAVAVHQQDKLRIYEDLSHKDQKAAPRFFAALDRDVFVMSPAKSSIVDAATRRQSKLAPKANPALAALVARQDGKQSIWLAAATSDALKKNLGQQAGQGSPAAKVISLGGGLTVADDLRVNFRMQMADVKAARDMRQQLEALKAVAVLAISVNEDLRDYAPILVDALNGLAISQDQLVVGVDLTVPGTLVEKGIQVGKNPAAKPAAGIAR